MYNDFLSVNRNFQRSVNLQLDLQNEQKIKEYIPTVDICFVLKRYFKTFLGKAKDKSTILEGPYGKGKSFLLLVLAYLTSADSFSDTYKLLIDKIQKVDAELFDLILEFNQKKRRFLPVVINSNYDDLDQSFRLALDEARRDYRIDYLVPKSTFSTCKSIIKKWEENPEFKQRMYECAKANSIDRSKRKEGIEEYSRKSYDNFKTLFRCLSLGLDFNPLVNDDIINIYSKTLREIQSEGFSGRFIIFDEFSKFIDKSNNITHDLKLVQDFAELASRSSQAEQIHFCCVTHKSLSLYENEVSKSSIDAFRTIEGRFKEIVFNRSLDENYDLISHSIIKENTGKIEKAVRERKKFYSEVKESGMFSPETDWKSLFYGCFPLNPITTYALIQISELVAQNERTLFTFISDTEENSLNSFLQKNESGLMNVDSIYDYFSDLMSNSEIDRLYDIWLRSESVLSSVFNPQERKIVKCIAIRNRINDYGRFPPKEELISLSLDRDSTSVRAAINRLLNNHFLRRDDRHNLLSFAPSYSKEIDQQINTLLKTKRNKRKLSSILNDFNEHKYLLPREYNYKNKITRYSRVVFIMEEDFVNLTSLSVLFDEEFSDGLILNLIPSNPIDTDGVRRIQKKINKLNDSRVIINIPSDSLPSYFESSVRKLKALKIIREQLAGAKSLFEQEIKILFDDLYSDVQASIDAFFRNNPITLCSFSAETKDLPYLCGRGLSAFYSQGLIINNELVNKMDLSAQYRAAVIHVVDWRLSGEKEEDFSFSETSPEGTVKTTVVAALSYVNKKPISSIIGAIKEEILKGKCQIKTLTDIRAGKPFGIRRGTQVFLLVKSIQALSEDTLVLKLDDKELQINGDNLLKSILASGNKYSLIYSKSTADERVFIQNRNSLFQITNLSDANHNLLPLSNSRRKFMDGLPSIVRHQNSQSDFLGYDKKVLQYRKVFLQNDINPNYSILQSAKRIFGSFENAFNAISEFAKDWKRYLDKYISGIIAEFRTRFAINLDDNLNVGLKIWKKQNVKTDGHLVLEDRDIKILSSLENSVYDDQSIVESVALAATGHYIEDWNCDLSDSFRTRLDEFIVHIRNAKTIQLNEPVIENILNDDKNDYSPLGITLKNSIDSVISDFGESVSKEEKIRILLERIKKL